MTQPLSPAVGGVEEEGEQWIVVTGGYPHYLAVGPVSKATAQRVYHPNKWGGSREQFTDLSRVVFRGPEGACRAVAEKLISSEALAEQEVRAARTRHLERQAEIIRKAQPQ